MKKSHSLQADSGRKPSGEPVDEPDRSFKTKVGITAHQVPSVYHPAEPGPFSPAQGTGLGAWNSGAYDAGTAGVEGTAGTAASGAAGSGLAAGTAARRITNVPASISRRIPVRPSRIQKRSVAATVRITSPRWTSLPLCHASIPSPTDSSSHDRTCCATSAVMACSFLRSGCTPASFRSPAPASSTEVSSAFPGGDLRVSIFGCSRFAGVPWSLPLP